MFGMQAIDDSIHLPILPFPFFPLFATVGPCPRLQAEDAGEP